jgi:hypothetical protein
MVFDIITSNTKVLKYSSKYVITIKYWIVNHGLARYRSTFERPEHDMGAVKNTREWGAEME